MTKAAVVNPPHPEKWNRICRFDHVARSGSLWYPIHSAYCTGLLEEHGHSVKLIDAIADGISLGQLLTCLSDYQPEMILVNYAIKSSENDISVARALKENLATRVYLVGAACSIDPYQLWNTSQVDGVIDGLYYYPALQIADSISKRKSPTGVVSWHKHLTTEQLDSFPYVTRIYAKHLNIRRYFQSPQLHPFVDMFTAQGMCYWGHCIFCYWQFTLNRDIPYVARSIENVIGEFQWVKTHLPYVKEVMLQDDTLPAQRVRETSKALIESGMNMTWSFYARPDKTMDYETLQLAKQAGARCMHVGYESADPRILSILRKGTTPEIMMQFTRNAQKVGLMIHGDFMIGMPYETEESARKTLEFAKELNVETIQFIIPHVYPETPLIGLLLSEGLLNDSGEVSYPDFTSEQIREFARKATLEYCFRWRYVRSMLPLVFELDELKSILPSILALIKNLRK